MKKKPKVRHALEYGLFLPFKTCLRLVPEPIAFLFSRLLGDVFYYLFRLRRRVVLDNLSTAFGQERSTKQIRQLAHHCYQHAAFSFVEFVRMQTLPAEKKKNLITFVEGEEYLKEVGGKERPWIALSAHIGNWERMAAYYITQDFNLMGVVKPIHNPYIDSWISSMRKSSGYKVISTKGDIREIVRHFKQPGMVAFLADQDARKDGIFVDFFGKPASTHTGPAVLSLRLGLPILPAFDIRLRPGRHKVVYLPPIYPPKDMKKEEAITWLTEQHVKALEKIVRQYPEQYFWFHKRWKTQPFPKKNSS